MNKRDRKRNSPIKNLLLSTEYDLHQTYSDEQDIEQGTVVESDSMVLPSEEFPSYDELKQYFHKEMNTNQFINNLIIFKLPGRVEINECRPGIPWLTEINDDYFEFTRPVPQTKLFMSIMFSFYALFSALQLFMMFCDGLFSHKSMYVLDIILCISTFYILPLTVRYSYFTPQALPVRFNRRNQKVYFFQRKVKANPFVHWPVEIIVMHWEHVQGWELKERTSRGIGYHALHCTDTYQHRKFIASQSQLYVTRITWFSEEMIKERNYIDSIWSYCQNYMAYKTVPIISEKYSSFFSWGNKWLIIWPEDIDKESRGKV